MKMDKIGLKLVKNMRRFEKKNVVHDHVLYGLLLAISSARQT